MERPSRLRPGAEARLLPSRRSRKHALAWRAAQDLEDLVAVAFELTGAHAGYRRKLGMAAGLVLDDRLQGGVVKDDVGRHFLGFGTLQAPPLQLVEQRAAVYGGTR